MSIVVSQFKNISLCKLSFFKVLTGLIEKIQEVPLKMLLLFRRFRLIFDGFITVSRWLIQERQVIELCDTAISLSASCELQETTSMGKTDTTFQSQFSSTLKVKGFSTTFLRYQTIEQLSRSK